MDFFSFFKRFIPRWIILVNDIIICTISLLVAFYLRFNFSIPKFYLERFYIIFPAVLSIRFLGFLISKTYAGILRFTSTKDALRIIITIFLTSVTLLIGNIIYSQIFEIFLVPYSVLIIDFTLATTLLLVERLFAKALYLELLYKQKSNNKILIYGADEFALATKRTIERDPTQTFEIVGFIDNTSYGKYLDQIPIYPISHLEKLINEEKITHLILSKKNRIPQIEKEIIDICIEKNVKVLRTPRVEDWINGQLTINQIRNIKIEDLLERPPIILDEKNITQTIANKKILITGAAGSIGSEIVRQLTKYSPELLIILDKAETPLYEIDLELSEKIKFKKYETFIGDITDELRMEKIFQQYKPQIVYHAAAYKHVPMMENAPYEAIKNNVLGTKILADLSVKYKVEKFIMISTDKAVNPTNIMGASKRIAEIYTQSLNSLKQTKFITTRFGNVLGSNGSVIPRFKKQIEEGGPITVTHPEITRYFMTIPEACQLVLEASAMGNGGEIFIFDMGKSVKILDLAKKMVKLAGLQLGVDIQIVFTGLRPGEKLYEELLNDSENTLPTHHPRIMIAKVAEYELNYVIKAINELLELLKNPNDFEIVKKMKEIVPEFQSQNSVYEILDKQTTFKKI